MVPAVNHKPYTSGASVEGGNESFLLTIEPQMTESRRAWIHNNNLFFTF